MREIKFRAWDKDAKKMHYLDGFSWDQFPTFYCWYKADTGHLGIPARSELTDLMQFTGLRDKNSKDIYDGDIVGFRPGSIEYPDHEFRFEVFWHQESCGFLFRDIALPMDGAFIYESIESAYQDRLEIIGNIYENPELLEAT